MDTARTGADEAVASTPDAERERLRADAESRERWKEWGPYLSERQWGTVREDYSAGGTAWEYFPHDHARSRAYRWGEDGIAGMSDDEQRVCLSLALWNGRDSILKERLFGLTNSQGNHGEDVKEEYFYLDAAPSHAYLRMLYKYPQRAFPYADLVTENAARGTDQPEYELRDTGVFAGNRYFDVFVEYAQAQPGDILMQVTAWNRGPVPAPLHVIPQLVLRNTWTWRPGTVKPMLRAAGAGTVAIEPCRSRDEPLVRRGPRRAPVHGERVQRAAPVESRRSRLFQGRLPPPHRPCRARMRESRAHRHQGGRLVSIPGARGRPRGVPPALDAPLAVCAFP